VNQSAGRVGRPGQTARRGPGIPNTRPPLCPGRRDPQVVSDRARYCSDQGIAQDRRGQPSAPV